MVICAYKSSIAQLRKDKYIEAYHTIARVQACFPFIFDTLLYQFKLALKVGYFDDANEIVCRLEGVLDEKDWSLLADELYEAVREYNAFLREINPDKIERLRAAQSTLTGDNAGKKVLKWIFFGVCSMIIMFCAFFWMKEGRGAGVVPQNQSPTTMTKMQHGKSKLQENSDQSLPTKNGSEIMSTAAKSLLRDRGIHATYHYFGLDKSKGDNRYKKMKLFVTLFPQSSCYTGPFYRELYDYYYESDNAKALEYARKLSRLKRKYPELSKFVSRKMQRDLEKEEKGGQN